MTEDLLSTTAIAHALVALMTNPANDASDPVVKVGFAAVANQLGHAVEKAVQPEADQQVELLERMRALADQLTSTTPDDGGKAAREGLAEAFNAFVTTVPGYHAA